jgi:hypothetical protein
MFPTEAGEPSCLASLPGDPLGATVRALAYLVNPKSDVGAKAAFMRILKQRSFTDVRIVSSTSVLDATGRTTYSKSKLLRKRPVTSAQLLLPSGRLRYAYLSVGPMQHSATKRTRSH